MMRRYYIEPIIGSYSITGLSDNEIQAFAVLTANIGWVAAYESLWRAEQIFYGRNGISFTKEEVELMERILS